MSFGIFISRFCSVNKLLSSIVFVIFLPSIRTSSGNNFCFFSEAPFYVFDNILSNISFVHPYALNNTLLHILGTHFYVLDNSHSNSISFPKRWPSIVTLSKAVTTSISISRLRMLSKYTFSFTAPMILKYS